MKNRSYLLFRIVALALMCLAIATVTINKTANIHAAPARPMLSGPPLSFAGTGFPDADPFSGRFITVSRGTGSLGNVGTTQTLLNIELQIPDGQPNFKIAIFDGDMGGHWDETDSGADQLTYMVFEDPDRNGMKTAGQLPIASYPSASMTDDGWFEATVAQTAAANNPDGFHYYHLVAEWNTLNVIDEANYFKVVVQGTPFLLAGSTIGFIGHPGGTINGVVHPITTFNGTFSFFLSNSNASSTFVDIFDGDLDLSTDGIDANSPALPPFQTSPLTDNEGAHPGNPSNPGISYTLTAPAVPGGNWSRTNSNPSGNQEWELFRIRTEGSPTPMASADITLNTGETIPQGLYQLQVFNVIVANNIFFHADFDLFAEQPCTRTIGDFVWNDQNGDGDFDAGEPGIPGVTVELRDAPTCAGPFPTAALATTTTNGSGLYQFSNLSKGCYQVTVVDGPGTPLNGFTKTVGLAPNANNNSQSNPYQVDLTDDECINDLTADFGYNRSCECEVKLIETDFYCDEFKWKIKNEGDCDVVLTDLSIAFPSTNGKLAKVLLGGNIVADPNPDLSSPATIGTSGLTSDVAKKTIKPGETKWLVFDFTNNAVADKTKYTVTIKFGDCVLQLIPPPVNCECKVKTWEVSWNCDVLRWTVKNEGQCDVALTNFNLSFPSTNGKLDFIKLGSNLLYSTPDLSSPANIPVGSLGPQSGRTIKPGEMKTFYIDFTYNASTDKSKYSGALKFGDCTLEFPKPPPVNCDCSKIKTIYFKQYEDNLKWTIKNEGNCDIQLTQVYNFDWIHDINGKLQFIKLGSELVWDGTDVLSPWTSPIFGTNSPKIAPGATKTLYFDFVNKANIKATDYTGKLKFGSCEKTFPTSFIY